LVARVRENIHDPSRLQITLLNDFGHRVSITLDEAIGQDLEEQLISARAQWMHRRHGGE
jgi:hypothetical protein